MSVPQRRGGANRSGRGVIQLVRESSRERAEREEALSLLEDLLRALGPEKQSFEEVQCHREPLPHQLGEVVGCEHKEPRSHICPQGVVVHLPNTVTKVRLKCSGVDTTLIGSVDLYVVGSHSTEQRNRTLQQNIEPQGGFAFPKDPARFDRLDVPFSTQPGQLLVTQFLKQEQGPNLIDITREVIVHHVTSFRDTGAPA
jgi:hypothetical protein